MSKAKVAGILAMFGLVAALNSPLMVDPEGALKTLNDADFTETKVTGYSWFGCGKGDLWHTEFTAKNQHGKEIGGVVCKGLFKGSTIRFD